MEERIEGPPGGRKRPVDKVRASRDGHEYHEAWVARKALQLLWPDAKLAAIAVEGLSPYDKASASAATVEIADITLYYGRYPAFEYASRTSIVQFKYSIANECAEFRATNAKETIAKFAKTYLDYKDKYGPQAVKHKLDFQLITNRPIYTPLLQAVDALARGAPQAGEAKRQSRQFKIASGLDGAALAAFAAKCKFIGPSGSLSATKHELARLIADWSATSDPLASARLGDLRQMVRDKAGYAGTDRNLITRADILAALGVSDAEDLLPCPAALADVGPIVEREQLRDAIALVSKVSRPLLVHGPGGIGKTVFMESLARAVSEQWDVVFFDCFGGGAYRSPEDARHLPSRGLIHIANGLAFRGLCDPMIPGTTDTTSLLRTFRRRLDQCVGTMKRAAPGRNLALFIDAIDCAQLFARERSEYAFPTALLESLHQAPIPGVRLIVSCRSERIPPSIQPWCQEFRLLPFSIGEIGAYLGSRLEHISKLEIDVAQARSGGNPRVLEYMVKSGRGVLDESEVNKPVVLDDLIQQRVSDALSAGLHRGYRQEDIDAFLAGLAVLPPPVPPEEYAGAHGMQLSEVESFIADLRPLLERTNQGIMFRDEPTETLLRNRYSSSEKALRQVASNLLGRQDVSVYSAQALPALLHKLGDGERLFALAFDDRIPGCITSAVGKRNVRYSRLKAATLHAAIKQDYNQLVQLLVELSTIAEVDQRGADYILNSPDLVVAAKDVDAKRRLFETRTSWPGTRRARLTIANCLAGELEEASRHAIATNDWIDHYRRTEDKRDHARPDQCDLAAIPFYLICSNLPQNAADFLRGWKDWCAFEICEYVFGYCHLAAAMRPSSAPNLAEFIQSLVGVGPLTAALSFHDLSAETIESLTAKLSRACKQTTKLDLPDTFERRHTYEIQDGLRRASALALSLGFRRRALAISALAPHARPEMWSLRSDFYRRDVFPFLFQTALTAAATRREVTEKDVIPRELVPVCRAISRGLTGEAFRSEVQKRIPKYLSTEVDDNDSKKNPRMLSRSEKEEAERLVSHRLQPLVSLTKALAQLLTADPRSVDTSFTELVRVWEDVSRCSGPYETRKVDNLFRMLGFEAAVFALWTGMQLKPTSVRKLLGVAHSLDIGADRLIQVVSILAPRPGMQALAGEESLKARALVQDENDIPTRASLFGHLARALLPASIDDASAYFRMGLEQMDAIGSGDWDFANELLLFASAIRGPEIDEQDFHRLTNICELNIPYEPEKFGWGNFARGLSKTAGARGLAKLSRWDDRSKIRLSYTLLPYLTALVQDRKMEADLALALNRLANPVEYWFDGTAEFAKAIEGAGGTDRPQILPELIGQFQDDNPTLSVESAVEVLTSLAERRFGKSSETTTYLYAAKKRLAEKRGRTSNHVTSGSGALARIRLHADKQDRRKRLEFKALALSTDPNDPTSLAKAIKVLGDFQDIGRSKAEFFTSLRNKVRFNVRSQYVRDISELENFNLYSKIGELKECRNKWGASSPGLSDAIKSTATRLIRLHADDLVGDGRFTGHQLKDISDLTGVPIADLVLDLLIICARPDRLVSGAVWLAFASSICSRAGVGQGQVALSRLLRSRAAKLADSVTDGAWLEGLYSKDGAQTISAALVWRMLGSPYAEDRWRAAHTVRCLARFGLWNIVDALVGKVRDEAAGPFQARELTFYYLHARLWLLIALARIALDHPREIARYKDTLLPIATEAEKPHVLMRHFAARALLACADSGSLTLEAAITEELKSIDLSPFPRVKKPARRAGDFHERDSKEESKSRFEFSLDYDFQKLDVDNLSQVFGKARCEVVDLLTRMVHQIDPSATSMYEDGGRKSPRRDSFGLTTDYHTYGQQLGWHALFLAAGQLLKKFPVTDDWYYQDDPWGHWLEGYLLTRGDGLWLSDGTDLVPLDTARPLLELVLTGCKDKLLELAGLGSRLSKDVIVEGYWRSADEADDITVDISSALVPPANARELARELTRDDPMRIWIPAYDVSETGDEFTKGDKKDYTPWIVRPSLEARLDEHDPFGTPCANSRSRLSREYTSALSLAMADPFGRLWKNRRGTVALRAQAWGRDERYSQRGPHSGRRLYCSAAPLKRILNKYEKSLLLVIKLRRYEKKGNEAGGNFSYTVAAVTISKALDLQYFKGPANFLQRPRN
jgi:hypothetical protein